MTTRIGVLALLSGIVLNLLPAAAWSGVLSLLGIAFLVGGAIIVAVTLEPLASDVTPALVPVDKEPELRRVMDAA